jgi:hypothetical protein
MKKLSFFGLWQAKQSVEEKKKLLFRCYIYIYGDKREKQWLNVMSLRRFKELKTAKN